MALLEGLFRLVVSLSLAGSAATLLVLGAKAVWKDRLGTGWNYYVWTLPLVLYLVPFAFSLPAGAGKEAASAGVSSGAASAGAPASAAASQAVQGAAEAAAPGFFQLAEAWLEQAMPVLAWAWALGTVFTLAVRLVDNCSLGASLKKCAAPCSPEGRAHQKFQEALAEAGIPQGRVELVVCPGVESPLLLGLWKAKVVIPREDYSDSQLEMMLRHELTHYRCRDLWYKAAALVVAAIHWFNPLTRLMLRDLDRSCELCCDRRTTRGMSPSGRRQYGRMLLDVAQGSGEGREKSPAASQGAFLAMDKKELKRRLSLLRTAAGATPLDRAVSAALCLVVAAVGVVCSSAANPGPVFRELFSREELPVVASAGSQEVPELWSGEASQPEAIPQPNPTDVPTQDQEPLQMQVVLSDEVQAAVAQAEAEAEAAEEAARQAAEQAAREAAEQAAQEAAQAEAAAGENDGGEPEDASQEEPAEDAGEESGEDEGKSEEESLLEGLSWDGSFLWPVNGGYITCGFYGYYGHNAVDIAADAGTEIYAAATGVVTAASDVSVWPYGKSVTIQHGDGVVTRYAHCSQVLVSVGDYVEQGDLIALVGRTGNASGNHCHFEIKIGGVAQDPVNYIGSTRP